MVDEWVIAAVQMTSSDDVEHNLKVVETRIKEAVDQGVKLVVLPENFALMATFAEQLTSLSEVLGAGPVQDRLSAWAKEYDCWIVAGSLPTTTRNKKKVYATCLVYNDLGEQVAHYHKMHLFDVDIADDQGRYRESDSFESGDESVVVKTPFGLMGLSICYDLRFPELYRQLLQKGAEFVVAPSAFTEVTGRAHWSLLCRTRAIENASYLIAANQGGAHINGRFTYGHSMIVDPWGDILTELGKEPGVTVATIKKARLKQVRQSLPAIKHRQLFI